MVIFYDDIGDVFKYKGKEYVYLAQTEEILYAARILSKEETDLIERRHNQVNQRPNRAEYKSHPLYCFVIL